MKVGCILIISIICLVIITLICICIFFNCFRKSDGYSDIDHETFTSTKKRIISFCVFGKGKKYTHGAIENAILAPEIYPGWICRFYIGDDVPEYIIKELETFPHVEIVHMSSSIKEKGLSKMLWRFQPLFEDDIDVFIVRDTDSFLNVREKDAVDEWLKSDKKFHIMRDDPQHVQLIMGGMWGCKGNLKKLKNAFDIYKREDKYGLDQELLEKVVYPHIKNNVMVHASHNAYEKGAKKFKVKYENFVVGHIEGDTPRTNKRLNVKEHYQQELNDCTVVVPCIPQHIQYLPDLLDSVSKQTLKPVEVIIALSQTEQKECEKLQTELQTRFPALSIRLSCIGKKAYAAENRNRGASLVGSSIISFIDADDLMLPIRIETIMKAMRAHRADALMHAYNKNSSDSFKSATEMRKIMDNTKKVQLHTNLIRATHGHISVKRDVFFQEKQDERDAFIRREDSEYVRRLVNKGYEVIFIPDSLSIYREELTTNK